MNNISRRNFLAGSSLAAASAFIARPLRALPASNSPFKVAVISDEISPDFDHACSIIANEFGLQWVELRSMWGKGVHALADDQRAEVHKILAKYNLKVTDIGSPLFKADWPGAPRAHGQKASTAADTDILKKQDELLEQCIAAAKDFGTDKIRCFDFWRIEDQKPYRAAINEKLRSAAERAGKAGLMLVLENEPACNTATGREAAAVLAAVKTPHLALNWDPGNAVMREELDAFPTAWEMLPKNRIHHCHCKNAVRNASGKIEWSPVDKGFLDWTAQFRALKQAGYRDAVSLETHWHGGGTAEESTRISWKGMKQCLQAAGAF